MKRGSPSGYGVARDAEVIHPQAIPEEAVRTTG